MFIEQGIKSENAFIKYIVGSLLVFLASSIGQLPLLLAIVVKTQVSDIHFPSTTEDFMSVLDSNLTLFLMLFSFAVALLVLFLIIKHYHGQTILSVTTSRAKIDWKRVSFSFSIWSVFTIVSVAVSYFFAPEDFEINFKPIPFVILLFISVLMIPIQTSTEEYVFRGYLMQGFGNLSKNKWFPLVMTSVIFGVMHIMNPEVTKLGYIVMVFYIGTGFLLGIMTLMDEGMELALGFHAANNLVGALLVTSDWTAFQTHSLLKDISEPDAGLDIILPVVLIYPIVLFILAKKYQWTNWKEKLTGTLSESDSKVN
jgi:membrane protease YdiL (CAAX protease family)